MFLVRTDNVGCRRPQLLGHWVPHLSRELWDSRGRKKHTVATDIYRHLPTFPSIVGQDFVSNWRFRDWTYSCVVFFTMGQRVKQNCPVVCKDDTAPAVHGYLWVKFNSVSLLLWNSNEIIVDAGDYICDICGTVYGMFNIRGMGQGWEYLLSKVKIDGQTKSKCISIAKGNQVGRVQTIHMFDSTP